MAEIHSLTDYALALLSSDSLTPQLLIFLEQGIGTLNEIAYCVLSGEVESFVPHSIAVRLKHEIKDADFKLLRKQIDKTNMRCTCVLDEDYPVHLLPLPVPPLVLWYCGNPSILKKNQIGIVGARRCSAYGMEQTKHFVTSFINKGVAIVSGGARGIDREAHATAIRCGGQTTVVLGCGLFHCYPPEQKALFESVVACGGVIVSEFNCNEKPLPNNFPRRNRIISGLSSTLLVVEAAKRSCSLITARIAVEEHGREVFSIPGPLNKSYSIGTNNLIKDGFAIMASDPERLFKKVCMQLGG